MPIWIRRVGQGWRGGMGSNLFGRLMFSLLRKMDLEKGLG